MVQSADDKPSYVSGRRSTGRATAAAHSCCQGATSPDADHLLNRPATGPEDRPLASRCVRPIGVGPPFTGSGPGGQETTLQIIQSPEAVVVRVEALRSQLIYLDGRPRPPASVHLETGAARGHWDGDTLVVEYTNFASDAMVSGVTTYSTPKAMAVSDGPVGSVSPSAGSAWMTRTCFTDSRWTIREPGRNHIVWNS